MNHHIEDDLLFLQTTLEADVKLNNGSTHDMDIDESSWTLDHQITKTPLIPQPLPPFQPYKMLSTVTIWKKQIQTNLRIK